MRYLVFIIALFAALQSKAQNNIVYGAGINYTNGAPTFTPPVRTSRVAIDTVTGKWYHFNTPGGWQLIGNTIEEIAGCTAPAYTPTKGDSKVVINNCSPQPELYFYNGSAWVLVGGGSVYAGEGIRIENDTIILDSLNFLDFRTGSALDGDVGRVQWNDTDGTLDINLKGGNVTLQIGQEEVSFVKNADNAGLIEGRAVYIVGADGANKTVRYAKADSDLTSATTFGLMTESANGGNKAFCTTFGLVRNLNTLNLTEGGIVWLSADTAGTLTAVRPTAPDHGVMIGFCVRKHATQGAIFVQVQNGYELNELHDVFVPAPTNGQILTWNSANARWEAATPANQLQTLSTDGTAGNISISSGNTITLNVNDADASATNELQTLSTGTNTLTLSNGGGTVTVDTNPTNDVTGSGASGQVSFWTGAQTQAGDNGLWWDNANKRIGVGITIPLATYHQRSTRASMAFNSSGLTTPIPFTNTGDLGVFASSENIGNINQAFGTTGGLALNGLTSSAASSAFIFSGMVGSTAPTAAALQFRGFKFDGINSRVEMSGSEIISQFLTGSNPNVTFFANANVLIRSSGSHTDGGYRLDINANNALNGALRVQGSGSTSTTWTAQFHNSATGGNNALMIRDDGRVGIGTASPNGKLHVVGEGSTNNIATFVSDAGNTIFQVRNDNYVGYRNLNSSFPTWFTSLTNPRVGLQIEQTLNTYAVNTTGVRFYTAMSNTAGICRFYELEGLFNPASGTATFKGIEITTTINQTGGANGNIIGFDYNPTFTNRNGKNIAALFRTGQVGIGTGTGTPDTSAALDVTSTTQGVLFPRMTTTQRNAIATPADGLVIYNTTDNKLQVRAGGAWVDLH